jgi:hypothetical protein
VRVGKPPAPARGRPAGFSPFETSQTLFEAHLGLFRGLGVNYLAKAPLKSPIQA